MKRRLAFIACCVIGITAAAQVNPGAPQAEQDETGIAAFQGNPKVPYQIRLLPVSSFPQLPQSIARELDQKGCMIPQTFEAHEPENVIAGSFEKANSSDWAALCSVKGVTTLYVFFQSNPTRPVALRSQPDNEWLGIEWSQDYGSAWGISTVPSTVLPRSVQADHAGIEDAFVGQSSVIHYFRNGQWTTLDSSQ